MSILDTSMGRVVILGRMNAIPGEHIIGATRYAGPHGGPGRVCLLTVMASGEVYGKLSINLVDADLAPDEFAVNHDLEEKDVAGMLASDAGITDTGRFAVSEFSEYRIFRLAKLPRFPRVANAVPAAPPPSTPSRFPDPKPGDRWRYEEGLEWNRRRPWLHVDRVVTEPCRWRPSVMEEHVYTVNGGYFVRDTFDKIMSEKNAVPVPLGTDPDDYTCSECGGTFNPGYWLTGEEYARRKLCLHDAHWADAAARVRLGKGLIIDGCSYSWRPDLSPGDNSHAGFGGALCRIQRADGSILVTRNLWHNGEIPPEWRERLPDNAVFLRDDIDRGASP